MAKKRGSNEGSIYKDKDGRWRGSVHLGYRGGKRVRKVLSGATRGEVSEKLKQLLRDQQLGLPVAPERLTVGQWLDEWLDQSVKNRVRPKSLVFYESIVRLHLKPEIGKISLQKLAPQHVQRLLNSKLDSGLAPMMVRHIRTTLITALEHALKFGAVSRNVAKLVGPPRLPKRELHPFTIDESRQFLKAAEGDRLGNLYVLMLSLGLRLSEALGMTWDEIDNGKLTIRHALQKLKGQPFALVETKSDHGNRTVVLPAIAVRALHRQRAEQAHDMQLAGLRWKGNPWGLVFASTIGTPLFHRNVHRRFGELLELGGLRRVRPHDMRHSAAALLIAQGVHPKAIQELLGHSSVAFTLQIYGHLFEEAKQETADQMDSVLTPVASSVASTLGPKLVQ
jgi:integrase